MISDQKYFRVYTSKNYHIIGHNSYNNWNIKNSSSTQ